LIKFSVRINARYDSGGVKIWASIFSSAYFNYDWGTAMTENLKTELVMVDHLSRDQLEEQLDHLSRLSTDDLRRELVRSLKMTADSLVKLALIVRSLEQRGEDLSSLKIGMMPYLRQIAYGQILPEVVVRYAEQPMLVRAISSLPFPDQEHLSTGGKVEMAVRRDDGTLDHRLVDPLHLGRDQIHQVFTRGRIRSPEEQLVMLEAKPRLVAKMAATETIEGIKVDHKRRGLIIGRRFVPAATVVEALAKLARTTMLDEGDSDDPDVQFSFYLSSAERDRMRDAAHQGNTTMKMLVRRCLRAAGLI
jgi:hypothetical protein